MLMSENPIQSQEARRIGQRVQWARQAWNYTRADLAREADVTQTMIQKIEEGTRIPSVFLVMSLCHVLGISPQYLLWGSMQGVEGELAAKLSVEHPELRAPVVPPFPGKTRKSSRKLRPTATL